MQHNLNNWSYNNDECEDIGIKPILRLNWIEHCNKIELLYAQHSEKFDIASERRLLMNPDISDKEKFIYLFEKCNESIREKNFIWFITGRSKHPNWHNQIPNLYL